MAGCTCLGAQAILPGQTVDWKDTGLDNVTIDYLKNKDVSPSFEFNDPSPFNCFIYNVTDEQGNNVKVTRRYDYAQYEQYKDFGITFKLNIIEESRADLSWFGVSSIDELRNQENYIVDFDLENDYNNYINSLDKSKFDLVLKYNKEYLKPADYTVATEIIDDNLDSNNTNKVLFIKDLDLQDSSCWNNYLILNTKDNSNLDLKVDFVGNRKDQTYSSLLINEGQLGNIDGDFIDNTRVNQWTGGGVISNFGKIQNISGMFANNYLVQNGGLGLGAEGGVIQNFENGEIGNISADFISNINSLTGYYGVTGALYNAGRIANIKGDFIANIASDVGGINNVGKIGNITGNFISNRAKKATKDYSVGAIYNTGTIGEVDSENNLIGGIINSNFIDNSSANTYFTTSNNSAGAISTITDLKIIADNGISEFTGNYLQTRDGGKDYRAIYVGTLWSWYGTPELSGATLTLRAENNGKIVMNDKISGDVNVRPYTLGGESDPTLDNKYVDIYKDKCGNVLFKTYREYNSGKYVYIYLDENNNEIGQNLSVDELIREKIALENYKLNINGDSTGIVYLNNNVEAVSADDSLHAAADISLSNTQLRLGVRDNVLDGNNLTLNSGTFNMINNQVGISALNRMTVNGDTDFVADVDLANKEMDRFTAQTYGEHHGNLNVVGMNLLSDANPNDEITAIYFAQPELKNNVTHNGLELPNEKYQNFEFYTPIYKYNVTYDKDNQYDNKGDGGYFLFTKGDKYFRPGDLDPENPTVPITPGGNTGNASDAFNPAVLSSPVSSVAAAQATINETFKYVFEHADAFTQMPAHARFAKINENKYALRDGASTDFNHNLGSLCPDHNNKAAWFRPYATFETMNLKNGPKVNATTYGSLAGFDTDFHEHKNGWHSVGTGYIGYNGSQLSYKGVDTTMNGGILGYTHTMYKGNFWTALTLSAGASVGESRTMYGKEDFTSLMAGVGSKTGYNFEFKEGKYILQPIMFMSYTFVNTFDYTNAAGVKINADPAHSIQLNPSIRFISNFKNGWQPYASVGMVWNVMNENNVTANNVRLPEMSLKPYVEYGVGVQRNWKDKFTAFGQAMLRNGGRNGIALTAGFRWALGKGVNDKVQAPKTDRTVLKQLTPQQKMALTGKKNTTITSAKAVVRPL